MYIFELYLKMLLVDQNTGEVYSGFAVPRKKRYPREIQESGFMTIFKVGLSYIASIDDLKGRDYRVLLALLTYMDFQNWISISQQTIAEEYNLQQQNVAVALKNLLKHQIIERKKDPTDKRRWMYRLNPSIGWMGDSEQWKKLMEDRANEKIVPLIRHNQH